MTDSKSRTSHVVSVPTQKGYDLWAKDYDTYANPLIAMTERAWRERPFQVNGRNLVELGCGTGRNLRRFQDAGAREIVGLDFSEGMLEKARASLGPTAKLIRHDIRQALPLEDHSTDVLLISLVLEHIADLRPVFREAWRVLRPGGELRIAEIHPEFFALGKQAHYRDGNRTEWVMESFAHSVMDYMAAANSCGFQNVRFYDWRPNSDDIAREPKLSRYGETPLLFTLECERT